jgi:serine/threonine protein kinase
VATGKTIAVKRLSGSSYRDAKEIARFRREARAAMALRHPNAVSVHGLLEWEGEFLILMDRVEGKTLRQILSERELSPSESIGWVVQIADALTRAHELGIVHRDVKPENVMVTAGGMVKLLDFGIAKLVEPRNSAEAPTPDLESLSREGVVLGSASYMSPEQIQALPVDARSDVFSLGALLYEMVTGRKAFEGTTLLQVVASVIRDEPPLLSSLGELEDFLRIALSKDPGDRFDSMAAFRVGLEAIRRRA